MRIIDIPPYQRAGVNYDPAEGHFMMKDLIAMLVSTVLGTLVGWERQLGRKPAGLRTHTLVCLGSTMFVLVTHHAVRDPWPQIEQAPDRGRGAGPGAARYPLGGARAGAGSLHFDGVADGQSPRSGWRSFLPKVGNFRRRFFQ